MRYIMIFLIVACSPKEIIAKRSVYKLGDTIEFNVIGSDFIKYHSHYKCSRFGEVIEVTPKLYRIKFFCENELDIITTINK